MIRKDDGPWFVLGDVCKPLEIALTGDAARRLDDDDKGMDSVHTPGGTQKVTIINESGLYSLILTSRKPAAKRFKKWVTSVVLPAIRKDGMYVMGEEKVLTGEKTIEELTTQVLSYWTEKAKRLEAEKEALAAKVDRLTVGK